MGLYLTMLRSLIEFLHTLQVCMLWHSCFLALACLCHGFGHRVWLVEDQVEQKGAPGQHRQVSYRNPEGRSQEDQRRDGISDSEQKYGLGAALLHVSLRGRNADRS